MIIYLLLKSINLSQVENGSSKLVELRGRGLKNLWLLNQSTGFYGRKELSLGPREERALLEHNNFTSGMLVIEI